MASFETEHTLESMGEYTTQLGTLTNSIDFGILVLTIIGAAGVMVSMLYKEYKVGKGSTVRSRLVLFLVFGDLFLGIIAIIPTISTLAGNHPKPFTPYCNALGFLIATALYAQHFNTLTLCISTYLILIYPLSLYTRWLERHWRWLFPFVWFSSFLCAGIAWGVIKYWGYNNGICIYPSGLFSEIWQFIPRAIVFTVITLLYLRLFVFLRRPDKIRTGSSSTDNQTDRSTELEAEPSHPSSQSHSKWRQFSSRTRASHTESSGLTAQLNRWIRSKSLGHDDRKPKALDFAEHPRRASLPLSVETSEIGTGEENNSRSCEYPPFATSEDNKSRSYGIPSTFGSSFGGGHRRKSRAGLPPWENVDLPRFPGSIDPITAVDPLDIEPSYPPPVTAGWKWGLSAPDSNSDFGGQGYSADQSACLPSSSPIVATATNKTNIAGTKTSNMVSKPKPADESSGDPSKEVGWDNLAVRRSSHVSFSEGSSLATSCRHGCCDVDNHLVVQVSSLIRKRAVRVSPTSRPSLLSV
ncbi:G protein-coupled receptor, rhodopsin-like [Phaffia rhodozyma]|uniref:G protein-coupled receptor, rhodopsin-like n=1 Tax=Phaffia rhodozyma TaxID=264483 RepID=A0A0F7SMY3_PHARH|nr:G protein-coupled receptor, rhodopsin-like [Phaffia rhodozyma]